jgi:hypothetical protein
MTSPDRLPCRNYVIGKIALDLPVHQLVPHPLRRMASAMDMTSRRVLGFALGERHDAQLACSALVMAVALPGSTDKQAQPGQSARAFRGTPHGRSLELV